MKKKSSKVKYLRGKEGPEKVIHKRSHGRAPRKSEFRKKRSARERTSINEFGTGNQSQAPSKEANPAAKNPHEGKKES